MIIKICGVKDKRNLNDLSKVDFNLIGLNFYAPSVRYVTDKINPSIFDMLPPSIKRVGVFVNHSEKEILKLKTKFSLDYAQLHGDEDETFGRLLAQSIPIIKVFRIREDFDISSISKHDYASYYIFDTFTKDYGGSGKKFNWNQLDQYKGNIPFFLSGGISPGDVKYIETFSHPKLAGIDINSRFESAPGIKDVVKINMFITTLNH